MVVGGEGGGGGGGGGVYSVHLENAEIWSCLLGPVSDNVLINWVSKGRALHQVIKYSPGAI